MRKSSVMKNEMRAIENSKAELHRTLNQLETDIQQESWSVLEHKLLKEERVELSKHNKQLEKQHEQQAVMLAEFQTENATLEVRLSNVGLAKPVTSVTDSGRLLAHVASMQRRATMADTQPAFTTEASSCGDLDGELQLDEDQGDIGLIAGSEDVIRGGIQMKANGIHFAEDEKANPYL